MPYTVTSGFADLDGTCEIDTSDNEITSYTSNNLGTATSIDPLSGPGLHAKVTFTVVVGPGQENKYKYHIHASPSGTTYSGHAKDKDDDTGTEEPWAATATGEPAVAAKAY